MTDTKAPQGPTRTPAERQRMYRWLFDAMHTRYGWNGLHERDQGPWIERFAGLLARCPQLWDSLPPDPAEQARREAEEDRVYLDTIQSEYAAWEAGGYKREYYPMWVGDLLDIVDRMAARAKAGHTVLAPPASEASMVLADREGK